MRDWLEQHILRHTRTNPIPPLQKIALVGLVLLVSISLAGNTLTSSLRSEVDRMLSAVLPSVIVDLTNEEREAEHLGTLKRNPLLDEAARLKGMHMKQNNYFAHNSREGVTPWYWFDVVKYDYLHAGENLAVYFDESDEVVNAWMDSPLHKENILKKDYTEIGVAVVEGEYDDYSTYYVVQLFGTPAEEIPVAPVATKPIVQNSSEIKAPRDVEEPENAVLGETVAQAEMSEKDAELLEEKDVPVLQEQVEDTSPTEITEPEPTTLVERISIDEKTVYLSDHASTSTVPAWSNPVKDTIPPTSQSSSALQVVYVLLLLIVVSLTIASILLAGKQHHPVQMVYGVALLIVTIALTTFHVHMVSATTLL